MEIVQIFGVQFVGALLAWSLVATVWIRPAITTWHRNRQLALWTTPLMFRFLGIGLMSANLAPGLDETFARNTAIGDGLTSVLAILALVALRKKWRFGMAIAVAAHVVGAGDLLIALPHAAQVKAATNMTAQWYVPAVVVPLMIVSHFMAFRALLARR